MALTGTTAVTRAPFPVEYIGKRKKGIRKRKTSAATHSMKLCQTPKKKKHIVSFSTQTVFFSSGCQTGVQLKLTLRASLEKGCE